MKKKLESELISIAHRILKLKGKEDVILLHQEAQKLYEKIAVLRFYEENFAVSKEEISEEALEEKLDSYSTTKSLPLVEEKVVISETKEIQVQGEQEVDSQISDKKPAIEEVIEEKKEIESQLFSPSFELTSEEEETKPNSENKQVSLEDFLKEDYKDLEFVKVEKVSEEVKMAADIIFEKAEDVDEQDTVRMEESKKTGFFEKKVEHKNTSLNDSLLKGINIGLNDRIAFVKHLFDGSDEDYNRVLSQLSTFTDFEEAENFIQNMVKPDHNNWENKEEYVSRFMVIVEKNFN